MYIKMLMVYSSEALECSPLFFLNWINGVDDSIFVSWMSTRCLRDAVIRRINAVMINIAIKSHEESVS